MTKTSTITLVGNLTRDPELRYTTTGNAVTSLGIAVNYRKKNVKEEWEDNPSFFNVTAWGELGEHVADSLTKGTRVVIVGRLEHRTWENDEGEKRSAVDIIADEVSPSLRWATASVTRAERETVGGKAPVPDGEDF